MFIMRQSSFHFLQEKKTLRKRLFPVRSVRELRT